MSEHTEKTRDELLALAPADYLAGGWRGPDGGVRRELLGADATAVATQLMATEASPQELAFTYEAVRALLDMHDASEDAATDPGTRMQDVVHEALMTVARMIRQPNNEGIAGWITECASFVRQPSDIEGDVDAHTVRAAAAWAVGLGAPPGAWPDDAEPSSGSSSEQPA